MQFADLQLIEPLLRVLRDVGYNEPSQIQAEAIPHVLAGRDLLGASQTGTGKTAAFALPILQRLAASRPTGSPRVRTLVLAPTRELAVQIGESFDTYGKHLKIRQVTLFGGVNQNTQIAHLRGGVEILVATPGRLLDLIAQGFISLDHLEILVLDEADRMLDMGFIRDVRRIVAMLKGKRQTLLFSATMPEEISALAENILNDPVRIAVTPVASTVEVIEQSVYFVEKKDKPMLLLDLLRDRAMTRVLIFTRTKHGANKVTQFLEEYNVKVGVIHGNKSQAARQRALNAFKEGTARILVATDIAARGIDVDDVTHVINYDLPNEPESYVHRIGRTGRAGASGIAYSFCDADERDYLIDIERLIQQHLVVATNNPYPSLFGPPTPTNLSRTGRTSRPPMNAPRPQSAPPRSQYSDQRPEQRYEQRAQPNAPRPQANRSNQKRRVPTR